MVLRMPPEVLECSFYGHQSHTHDGIHMAILPVWITRIIICLVSLQERPGFPLGLENLEKWEGIFQSGKSQGILNRLEKSGKITQNTGKLREFAINII